MSGFRKVLGAGLTVALVLHAGCHRDCDTSRPVPVQVLGAATEVLNPNVDGEPWALNLWLVELKSDQSVEGLDASAVVAAETEEEESPFGEDYVKSRAYTILPSEAKLWEFDLSPETTHVLTVGNFRQRVGDAWMQVYELPPSYPEQRCDAERKRKRSRKPQREMAPCIYLTFDANEVRGGRYPPAGFDIDRFGALPMACAPVVELGKKKKKKKRKRRTLPSLQPPPSVPSTPTTPAPAAPTAPTAPAKPVLPVPR